MADERTDEEILRRLHRGLRERRSPQDVAVDLVALRAERWLSAVGARDLYGLMRRRNAWQGATDPTAWSMPSVWRHHPGLTRAYAAAGTAMAAVTASPAPHADPSDPAALRTWLGWATGVLGLPGDPPPAARPTTRRRPVPVGTWNGTTYHRLPKPAGARGDRGGHVDARARMDAATRRERLPGVPVRAYRRAVRAVLHLQQRTEVLAAERDREAAVAFGKARLAHLVSAEDFVACPATAAFTAYYVARLNLRTRFTSGRQTRPMDSLGEALLEGALAAPTCRPAVLAAVLTRWRVLDLLSDAECGALLGRYYEQMAACARALRASYEPGRDPRHMIVRAGDDSSTWNAASRAFNQARTGWLNLTRGLGYDDLAEASCPGKVPALVAADVAAWHAREGHDQHVDVRVWADLPLPWDVVLGDDECPADLVRDACERHGVDPERSGWTQPFRQDLTELPEPAPDLVHGVAVASPLLATVLRRAGIFSGQA
ncbi:hypothetical protein Daura_26990 [Dactylosporangium aurantiacum]|uniref:Uncharacterized protein n=1 Tax=Dactylosporangium aurantiacum TaxID=35754 RepID=A0A9Q9IA37_9ACTN|nr:hypothetical protein [Dactylosporangium aurantiacum]MDG6106488.1 hypothetical protein [Dactylosporangium aurantiacum]UWZ50478.1 hypothetical protein Daura_26990 [Dactylosporangium aurantiacum]